MIEIIFTFFLGVLIEGISYFRYSYMIHAYGALSKNSKEG